MIENLIGVIKVALIVALIALSLLVVAQAHSWYDAECCSNDDCKPVAAEEVIETETGWKHLPTGTEFTKDMVKPSRDRNFHVCIGKHSWNFGKPYCIYILSGA